MRKVNEVIYYTLEHRRYYYGLYNNRTYSLDEAATKVGVYKILTINDYFQQLEKAYLTGMCFDEPGKLDMGHVRAHNR